VHNAEEAAALPDHIVGAWPREHAVDRLLRNFNRIISRTEEDINAIQFDRFSQFMTVININDFGLTYPLTAIDLVDNWESVNKLFQSLVQSDQERLRRAGRDTMNDPVIMQAVEEELEERRRAAEQ